MQIPSMFRLSSIEARKRFAELAMRLLDQHLANDLKFEVAVSPGQIVTVELHRTEAKLAASRQDRAEAEVAAA
jgi:hypothetical protein